MALIFIQLYMRRGVKMTKSTIIHEIAFEKNCSLKKATEIYQHYKNSGNLEELLYKLKYHKEV